MIISKATRNDVLLLVSWSGLLLATTFLRVSLMAHDEGNFAAGARFMAESGRWVARLWWDSPVYTHGIMLNWLIVVSYKVFGIYDWAARMPSAIACIIATLLTYDISKIITGKRVLGLLSGALLMLFHLWFQYGHLATQDMLIVCLELLGIWSLLKAEAQPSRRIAWGVISGLVLGLGFLTKSFMILLPAAAIAPYLIFQHRRHRHLTNLGLYIGLLIGVGLVGLWLQLSIAQYGDVVMASLFGKVVELGEKPFHADAGRLYYLWNIPANGFPWPLFSLFGVWFCWQDGQQPNPYRWLLIYPFILFGMLTSFSTRTPYYALQLYPSLALFSAIALHRIATQPIQWPRCWLSRAFGLLGFILAALGLTVLFAPDYFVLSALRPYAAIAILLGLGWACLPLTANAPSRWIATWLLPTWLALGAVGVTGLYGNYSPGLKADLKRNPIASVLAKEPVNFIIGPEWADAEAHKTMILLSFYTPILGEHNPDFGDIEPGSYAWLASNADHNALSAERPYEPVGRMENIKQFQLIRFLVPQ